MHTSLSSIIDATRACVTDLQTRRRVIEEAAAAAPVPPSWTEALCGDDVAVIAEVKRRSPSAGAIAPELDAAAHAKRYAAGGARALSVLTEGPHFGGSPDDLVAVRRAVPLPILRKDFIVDPIQLYETRALGASAVLLIVRALDDAALGELAELALELGLARLVEVHDAGELTRALRLEPETIGVNSRDLVTLRTDLSAIEPIVRAVPANVLTVAESGITSRQDVERVARWGADAILVGTVLARMADPTAGVREFTGVRRGGPNDVEAAPGGEVVTATSMTVDTGRFGPYGGRYVPETLTPALDELAATYDAACLDPAFTAELDGLLRTYVGRPTPLSDAVRLSAVAGGRVLLKREDLSHTGAHKINNTLGQVLLARRMGKRRIIAETGAGQHGVATATACARFGLECVVYMGAADMDRQRLNVFRMELLGATVVPVTSGTRTLKDATNEALRDWVTNVDTTHYVIGSVVGPDPFPRIVRDLQRVIGRETREQVLELVGRLPDTVVACVGGGSNAIGIFAEFLDDSDVRLVGVEAAGKGVDTGQHAASLIAGRPGVLHGSLSYLLQDDDGQVVPAHSVSAGLDYPGVGPEHAHLRDTGRADYVAVTDREALAAFATLARLEGILPALETAHAVAWVLREPSSRRDDELIVINVSGRGDKDVAHVAALTGGEA